MKRWIFLGFLSLLWIGCAGTSNQNEATYNLIVKEVTPLKENGPHQTTPASKNLVAGERIRIINNLGDYVYVETVDGQRGFIPKDTLEFQGER